MRILVVGTGSVGQNLANIYRASDHEVVVAGRDIARCNLHVDLVSGSGFALEKIGRPDLAIMAAGQAGFAKVAADPKQSHEINVANSIRLLDNLCLLCPTVFLSTSAVFDGSEAFPNEVTKPSPKDLYAEQKLIVEAYLQKVYPKSSLIVRLTKLIPSDFNLVADWRAALIAGIPVSPFLDLMVAPISPDYLADSLITLAKADARGLCHLSADRDISYAEFCGHLCAGWGCDPKLVLPMRSTMSNSGSLRRFAALGMARSQSFGLQPCATERVIHSCSVVR